MRSIKAGANMETVFHLLSKLHSTKIGIIISMVFLLTRGFYAKPLAEMLYNHKNPIHRFNSSSPRVSMVTKIILEVSLAITKEEIKLS